MVDVWSKLTKSLHGPAGRRASCLPRTIKESLKSGLTPHLAVFGLLAGDGVLEQTLHGLLLLQFQEHPYLSQCLSLMADRRLSGKFRHSRDKYDTYHST